MAARQVGGDQPFVGGQTPFDDVFADQFVDRSAFARGAPTGSVPAGGSALTPVVATTPPLVRTALSPRTISRTREHFSRTIFGKQCTIQVR